LKNVGNQGLAIVGKKTTIDVNTFWLSTFCVQNTK